MILKRLLQLSIFGTFIFSKSAFSYPYSIKNAFCSDYASNKTIVTSKTYQYDFQRNYDYCFSRANSLINEHEGEKNKKIEKEKRIEQANIENERYQEQLKKRQENKKKFQLNELRKNIQSIFK